MLFSTYHSTYWIHTDTYFGSSVNSRLHSLQEDRLLSFLHGHLFQSFSLPLNLRNTYGALYIIGRRFFLHNLLYIYIHSLHGRHARTRRLAPLLWAFLLLGKPIHSTSAQTFTYTPSLWVSTNISPLRTFTLGWRAFPFSQDELTGLWRYILEWISLVDFHWFTLNEQFPAREIHSLGLCSVIYRYINSIARKECSLPHVYRQIMCAPAFVRRRLNMCLEISAAYSTTSVNTQILSCSPVDPGRMRRNVSVTFTISSTWSFWHCSKAQFTWWNRCTYIYWRSVVSFSSGCVWNAPAPTAQPSAQHWQGVTRYPLHDIPINHFVESHWVPGYFTVAGSNVTADSACERAWAEFPAVRVPRLHPHNNIKYDQLAARAQLHKRYLITHTGGISPRPCNRCRTRNTLVWDRYVSGGSNIKCNNICWQFRLHLWCRSHHVLSRPWLLYITHLHIFWTVR